MSLNLSNGSDFSSNGSSDLNNKKGSNNNMTSSLMSHDSYVHYHVDKIRKKDNMLKVFAFLLVLLLVLLAIFVTLYFHTVVKYTKDTNSDNNNKTHGASGGTVICKNGKCHEKGTCNNKECVKISSRKYQKKGVVYIAHCFCAVFSKCKYNVHNLKELELCLRTLIS